jgi:peptide/nickel transport system substrate-binding protein
MIRNNAGPFGFIFMEGIMKKFRFNRPVIRKQRLLQTAAGAIALAAAFQIGFSAQADTVRIGIRDLPPGLGNPYTGRGMPHVFVWHAIFDELTAVTKTGETVPKLASSWSNVNPTTWRFTLRQGVKFSNGEAFNAAAVKATIDWLMSEEGKITVVGKDLVKNIAEAKVINDNTLEIITTAPNPIAPKQLSFVSIVAPKAWADKGLQGFAAKPEGTGAFKMVEFAPGNATAVANTGSWRSRADVDRIEYTVLPDPAARTAAIISDQIDVDVLTSRDSFAALRAGGVKIFTYPAGRTLGITIVSANGGPFADKRVRQAANYAVNKVAMIEAVYGGEGQPASQSATSNAFGFNTAIKPYPHDPAKARALLAEAGFADGVDMEIQAITTSTERNLIYQAAVQDLNQVGFRATLISQTFPDWLKHWLAGDWPYQAFGFGTDLTGVLDAGRAFNAFVSCKKNPPYYCNEDEMGLVNAQAAEFDVEKRKAILEELLMINAANAPILFLTEGFEAMSHQPRIQNFDSVNQRLNYDTMIIN